jgi:peptidoglycan/xylan/chitin deacetylase (PgdA/CDA1 family)
MILFLVILLCLPAAAETPPPHRLMALTFDDLPNGGSALPLAQLQAMTARLLKALRSTNAQTIGFVNGQKLEMNNEAAQRTAVLQMWLDAGYLLGNHTYSHPDINDTPLLTYQADVLQGEQSIRPLLEQSGWRLAWFRHPYTHTGPDAVTRQNLDAFLFRAGYRIAPFTVEHSDYIFEAVYRRALQAGDKAQAARIRAEYLNYLNVMCDWFEKLSVEYLGYEPPQVLLLHANLINADTMPEMISLLRARGYAFVSLEDAMRSTAYHQRDGYVGTNGQSWLYRWAITQGKPDRSRGEPDPPAWIMEQYRASLGGR